MSKEKQLIEAVLRQAHPADDRSKLSCRGAFKLAEQFGVKIVEIGRICNEQNIRISQCQLGCFK